MSNESRNGPNLLDPNARPKSVNEINPERTTRLKNLIALGRERGYVLERELATELTCVGVNQDQLADIASTFPELGIPVFSELPSAEALAAEHESIAALSRERAADYPNSDVPGVDIGAPIDSPFVVMRVGAEVGDLRLIAQKTEQGCRFRTSMCDQTLVWIEESENSTMRQSPWVTNWDAALTLMDKYPWATLHPLVVHPEFRAQVLAAARERLFRSDGPSGGRNARRLKLWEAIAC